MKRTFLFLAMLIAFKFSNAQTDIPMTTSGGPMSSGSWLRFVSGGDNTSIQENWGLNLNGSSTQPVKVTNASFLVGYNTTSQNVGVNNACVAGNIGINKLNPEARLDIFNNNNNGTNIILAADFQNSYRWRFNTVDRGNAIDMDITASNNGDAQQSILKLSPDFSGRPSFILMNNWLVAQNGNIGIGTTDNATWQLASSPYKLAVNGSMIATSIKVKSNSNWPDYVFKPSYSLRPLSEVKSYIDQNQHLPEVPAAATVEKEGMDVGEMNKILLKKVEELTLYLIQKDEELKHQQKEIDDLKKAVTPNNH